MDIYSAIEKYKFTVVYINRFIYTELTFTFEK